MNQPVWRTSSRSNGASMCVEVAQLDPATTT